MDKELIERLAREAGCDVVVDCEDGSLVGIYGTMRSHDIEDITPMLGRFAACIAEECAKLCSGIAPVEYKDAPEAWCAERIRAKFKA